MRAALRRVIQLVVVLLCVSFFSFALLSLAPGDPVVAIVGFASPAQLDGDPPPAALRPAVPRAVLGLAERLPARQPRQPVLRPDRRRQGVDRARPVAAGVAAADGLRDDPHDPHRDPARRARRVPVGHRHRQGHQHRRRSASIALPDFALALDPLVLGRGEAALAAVAGLRAPDRRLRHAPADAWRSPRSASRSARSRPTCACCAAT